MLKFNKKTLIILGVLIVGYYVYKNCYKKEKFTPMDHLEDDYQEIEKETMTKPNTETKKNKKTHNLNKSQGLYKIQGGFDSQLKVIPDWQQHDGQH